MPALPARNNLADEKDLIRDLSPTVIFDLAKNGKPTHAECLEAFELVEHSDITKDSSFYIKDSTGNRVTKIRYYADGSEFHYEILTKAK